MARRRKARILVIDDDESILQMIEMLLKQRDYDVRTAVTGVEGLNLVDSYKPHLVILDVLLPLMKGTELCRRLRSEPETERLPILMISQLGDIDQKLEGFEAGADDYMSKPLNSRELLARVRALLNRSDFGRTIIGDVVALIGAKGGVGVSTVAVNVAAALNRFEYDVTLAEFAWNGGTVRQQMNIGAGTPDMSSLAAMEPEALTDTEIRRHYVSHSSGISVLLSGFDMEPALTSKHADKLIPSLKYDTDFVLLDLPPVETPFTERVLRLADHILLVTEGDLLSAVSARHRLQRFFEKGIAEQTSVVGVARVPSGMMMTRVELENEVGLGGQLKHIAQKWEERYASPEKDRPEGIIAMIPPSPESMHDSVRAGVPLVSLEPSNRTARSMMNLGNWVVQRFS